MAALARISLVDATDTSANGMQEGFYEWLQKGKEKIPHYTKRKDGQLMCFAGLW